MIKEYKILDRTARVEYDEYEVARVTKDAMESILIDLPEKIRADERKRILQKAYEIDGYCCEVYGVNCIEANADSFGELVEWLEKGGAE